MATPRKRKRKDRSGTARGPKRGRKGQPTHETRDPVLAPRAPEPGLPSVAGERARRARPAVIFEALATLLAPYAHLFEAEMHERMGYCLKTYGEWPTEVYFAGVQWTEDGLYFHLFPIAGHPELVTGLSPALSAHREGRVSFRFQSFETPLFAELAQATAQAYQILAREGVFGCSAAA